jgi:predicted dienelactone hydrolase
MRPIETPFPVFHLPHPSGRYEIGTLSYHWIDAARPELFTTDPKDHRELMVQLWYPSEGTPSLPRAPYVQDTGALLSLARLLRLPEFAFERFKDVFDG